MRVDLNHGAQSLQQTEHSPAENAPAGNASQASELGEDQAQLSGVHTQVAALAAQAAQLPEAREERVQSLRQAVLGGRYSTTAEQVAEALFNHLLAGAA